MITLLLSLAFMVAGIYVLKNKFNVRSEDIDLMFAGAMLLGAIQNLAAIIVLLFAEEPSSAALIGQGISLLINGALGYFLLKKSRVL